MDQKVPFTSCDSWACLCAGCLLPFAFDSPARTKLLTRDTWTVVLRVVAVSLAFAGGQFVASASSVLFEKMRVGKPLRYPHNLLFGQPNAWDPPGHLLWARIALGIRMALRYPKSCRRYAVELFMAFAWTKEPEKKP